MVVANYAGRHANSSRTDELIYESVRWRARATRTAITSWEKAQELRSGKVTLWDHCFELPHKHLEAEISIQDAVAAGKSSHKLKVGGNDKLEIYDYPGGYAQRFDGIEQGGGEQPAEIPEDLRGQASGPSRSAWRRRPPPASSISGASNVRHLVSGHTFTLEQHFDGDGRCVLTRSSTSPPRRPTSAPAAAKFSLPEPLHLLPRGLPFRPPRVTPAPVVQGTQTAVVVGPPGEEIFTDKYGRVKVQFHWDREGKNDDDSSCWIRVAQPLAGRRWGASFWPRIGQEVIVDFLEGDPDRPIIVGSVYNADQMPPYLGDGPDPKHPNDNKAHAASSRTRRSGAQGSTSGASTTPRARSRSSSTPSGTWTCG